GLEGGVDDVDGLRILRDLGLLQGDVRHAAVAAPLRAEPVAGPRPREDHEAGLQLSARLDVDGGLLEGGPLAAGREADDLVEQVAPGEGATSAMRFASLGMCEGSASSGICSCGIVSSRNLRIRGGSFRSAPASLEISLSRKAASWARCHSAMPPTGSVVSSW